MHIAKCSRHSLNSKTRVPSAQSMIKLEGMDADGECWIDGRASEKALSYESDIGELP